MSTNGTASESVLRQLDEINALIRMATTERVKSGLYLLSVRTECPDPVVFDEMLRSNGLCVEEARESMLVAALVVRVPASEKHRLLGKFFDDPQFFCNRLFCKLFAVCPFTFKNSLHLWVHIHSARNCRSNCCQRSTRLCRANIC